MRTRAAIIWPLCAGVPAGAIWLLFTILPFIEGWQLTLIFVAFAAIAGLVFDRTIGAKP